MERHQVEGCGPGGLWRTWQHLLAEEASPKQQRLQHDPHPDEGRARQQVLAAVLGPHCCVDGKHEHHRAGHEG